MRSVKTWHAMEAFLANGAFGKIAVCGVKTRLTCMWRKMAVRNAEALPTKAPKQCCQWREWRRGHDMTDTTIMTYSGLPDSASPNLEVWSLWWAEIAECECVLATV